ncbi:MAG: metallophosphoesterase [Chlamydiia bacterium]|nr:metallophosphoesterase [Chlamydiia bacterium]
MRIAQISDFHYTHWTWNPFRLCSKRMLGALNWLCTRKSSLASDPLDALPDLLRALKVDLVLLGGDFTTTALIEEYQKAVQFTQKLSMPWIAIPGNHDYYTYRSSFQKHFYRYLSNRNPYAPITHPTNFFSLKQHGIEAHSIAPHWWVLALDTARATNPYSSKGLFSEKQEKYMEEILHLLPPEDSLICLNHYPFVQGKSSRRNLERGEALQSLLEKTPQIRLYLHGHTHKHAIVDLQSSQLPLVLDSGCVANTRTGTWNLIDLMPDDCQVSAYRWNSQWEPFCTEKIRWKRL